MNLEVSMGNCAIFAVPLLLFASAVADAQAGHRVNVNGMRMYYEVSGSGSPLVVLHGSYMNLREMWTIIPNLARTHQVYALQLQGHGRTKDIYLPRLEQTLA